MSCVRRAAGWSNKSTSAPVNASKKVHRSLRSKCRNLRVDTPLQPRLYIASRKFRDTEGHEDVHVEDRGHRASLVAGRRNRPAAWQACEPCRTDSAGEAQADLHAVR